VPMYVLFMTVPHARMSTRCYSLWNAERYANVSTA